MYDKTQNYSFRWVWIRVHLSNTIQNWIQNNSITKEIAPNFHSKQFSIPLCRYHQVCAWAFLWFILHWIILLIYEFHINNKIWVCTFRVWLIFPMHYIFECICFFFSLKKYTSFIRPKKHIILKLHF